MPMRRASPETVWLMRLRWPVSWLNWMAEMPLLCCCWPLMVAFAAPDPPLVHSGARGRMAGFGPDLAAEVAGAEVAEMKCMGTGVGAESSCSSVGQSNLETWSLQRMIGSREC